MRASPSSASSISSVAACPWMGRRAQPAEWPIAHVEQISNGGRQRQQRSSTEAHIIYICESWSSFCPLAACQGGARCCIYAELRKVCGVSDVQLYAGFHRQTRDASTRAMGPMHAPWPCTRPLPGHAPSSKFGPPGSHDSARFGEAGFGGYYPAYSAEIPARFIPLFSLGL